MTVFEAIYQQVAQIPKGRVASYGFIAKQAGTRDARVVGWALHVNQDYRKVPCYRVVTKEGELAKNYAHGGAKQQRRLLEQEGVRFDKGGRVKRKFFI